jgi:hypothetical protein
MNALTPYLLVCVALLGHPSYRTREAAHCHLRHLGSLPIPALLAGERHSDPEVAVRCRLLVDCWLRRHADEIIDGLRPQGWERLPWLALPDHEGRLNYGPATGYVEAVDPKRWPNGGPEWANWSEASRRWLRDLLVARGCGDPWKAVRQLAERQRQWCRETGAPIPP